MRLSDALKTINSLNATVARLKVELEKKSDEALRLHNENVLVRLQRENPPSVQLEDLVDSK